MASQISGENRILAIGLGVSVVATLGLMRYMLIAFRDASEVEQPAPKTQYIDQKTEDALMPSTLEKLISSHNKDIQGVASRIVLDRALHDPDTIGGLLWEVTSKDPERREKALRVLHLICGESKTHPHNQLQFLAKQYYRFPRRSLPPQRHQGDCHSAQELSYGDRLPSL